MQTLQAVSDSSLIESFLSGNQKAFEQLVRRHQSRVYSTALLVVRDKYVAEDILQDSFIRFFNVLQSGKYREDGRFLPYILRISHNLAIDYIRNSKRVPTITSSDGEDVFRFLDFKTESALDCMEKEERNGHLKWAISKLPDDQREVVILRHFGKMSFKEIADLTGLNINTTLGKMRYALVNLRKHLVVQKKTKYDPNFYPR